MLGLDFSCGLELGELGRAANKHSSFLNSSLHQDSLKEFKSVSTYQLVVHTEAASFEILLFPSLEANENLRSALFDACQIKDIHITVFAELQIPYTHITRLLWIS